MLMRAGRDADGPERSNIADLPLEGTVIVKDLDALVAQIRHVHVPLRVDRDGIRRFELAFARALRSPGFDEAPGLVQFDYAGAGVGV